MFSDNKNFEAIVNYEFDRIVEMYDSGPPIQNVYYLGNDNMMYACLARKTREQDGKRSFRSEIKRIMALHNFKKFL